MPVRAALLVRALAPACLASACLAALAGPGLAQDAAPRPEPAPGERTIRNAPSPRAIELAAYVFSAANVCGFRIGVPEFEALMAKQNVKASDIGPRGPFGARVQTTFALMSNEMARNREAACLAVAGEYGPDGTIAKNVLQPAPEGTPPAEGAPPKAQ